MNILIIGASGTIGKRLAPVLAARHRLITAGRNSGDHRVDITDEASVQQLFRSVKDLDAVICIAASGPMDNFATLTEATLLEGMKGKLFGQVNLVLTGMHYLNPGGCFVLTSGIFADVPYKGVTGGAMTSGALHSFVLSAALELPQGQRINVVSPGMVADSAKDFGHLFPGLGPVSMARIVAAYTACIEEGQTGQIVRVY